MTNSLIENTTIENVAKKLYTIEQYMTLPDDGKQYELVKGELVEMAGPSGKHGEVVNLLGFEIRSHLRVTNNQGRIFTGAAFTLDKTTNTARVPDIGFVAAGRIPAKFGGPVPVPPDLAIEVISPSETTDEIQNKIEDYQQAKIRLIWSIYLRGDFVLVRRADTSRIRLLNLDEELDGEDVIPGFKLAVSKLFE